MNRKIAILALMRLEGISRSDARLLLPILATETLRSSNDLLHALAKHAQREISANNAADAWRAAQSSVERCSNLNIQVIAPWEESFPSRLLTIPDSPLMLFVRGNVDCLNAEMSAAVIGTREPTSFGSGSAFRISSFLADAGVCIVSGLAKGCDTQGHLGCLDAGGQTIAVLAHGLDQIYPPENAQLAQRILASDGCLVSEYVPGTKPAGLNFIQRDRIQSGLSDTTIVVETGIKGGTLHTAGYCLQQGRMLAVVAHPAAYQHAEKVQGNKMLINKKGGVPIGDRADLEKVVLKYLVTCQKSEHNPWSASQQLTMQLK